MESPNKPERIEDAIDEVIQRCGGRKAFSAEMWPGKSQRDAHNLLDACLNPERREKFSPGAVVYIAKRGHDVGCHAVIQFISTECGYAPPTPISTADERSDLEARYIEAAKEMSKIADRIERITFPRAVA
jgi:hypothetical protein